MLVTGAHLYETCKSRTPAVERDQHQQFALGGTGGMGAGDRGSMVIGRRVGRWVGMIVGRRMDGRVGVIIC